MCYWNGGVPKDFLGGEILRGSKGVEQEQNRPLLWSVKGTSFLIQMCIVLGILKDDFEVWKTWIFIIGLNWVGVFETQLVFFFFFSYQKEFYLNALDSTTSMLIFIWISSNFLM